jgi:pimeloyl-ACP methyl ester carboxylesterase
VRITVNATALYFDVEGASLVPDGPTLSQRPTLLLLHGGPGFDHAYFKPAFSALADCAQVVYLDLRAQGRSAQAAVQTCTLEQMADDVAAFCAALDIQRPIVLGHSAGGFVALTLAVRHPTLAERLVLVDTAAATADMADSMSTLEARHGREARLAAERMFGGDFSEPVMADFMRLVFPAYVSDPTTFGAVAEVVGRSPFNVEVARFYFAERAPLYDVRASLDGVNAPTLVIVGADDWLTPPSASRSLAAALPRASLVEVPRAGHFPFLEQPAACLSAIRQFVAEAATELAPMPTP